ncbi:unnamed protein product [Hyaloperonospora brassicae]|uniref:Uncharacterized protein n=1 Tax=Hyaloperonospora brassicae TaxID=162125 RepID=A0AAV0UX80_HYABA|nr:unnamed protein product [Hyaloperonospora brassicae]
MGDPCGHKNTMFVDAVQRGRDRFDSAALAGLNAVFCRQAFDSIGGIQYGTQSEDAFTGTWSTLLVGTRLAAAMGQKKRWAKGGVRILLMQNERDVDPDWRPPRVPAPGLKPSLAFPRKMILYDSVLYPFLVRLLPCVTSRSPSTTCGHVTRRYTLVERRSSGMAFVLVHYDDGSFEAIQARVTGKDKSRASTGAGQKTPWTEIPDVLFFFTLLFSQLVALVRFFEHDYATNLWNYVSAMFCGFFVMSQYYPMVKMSIPEYCGWGHTAATFTANVFGSLLVVYSVVFVQLW